MSANDPRADVDFVCLMRSFAFSRARRARDEYRLMAVDHMGDEIHELLGNALNEGKSCVAAIGEVILNVPGLLAQGAWYPRRPARQHPGSRRCDQFRGGFLESAGCAILADISEFLKPQEAQ
jgi:hypothetical protein